MNDYLLGRKETCEALNLYMSFKRYDKVYAMITTGNLELDIKNEEYRQGVLDTLIFFNELLSEHAYQELFYFIENWQLISKYARSV